MATGYFKKGAKGTTITTKKVAPYQPKRNAVIAKTRSKKTYG